MAGSFQAPRDAGQKLCMGTKFSLIHHKDVLFSPSGFQRHFWERQQQIIWGDGSDTCKREKEEQLPPAQVLKSRKSPKPNKKTYPTSFSLLPDFAAEGIAAWHF